MAPAATLASKIENKAIPLQLGHHATHRTERHPGQPGYLPVWPRY